ncbi:MAG: MmgE/PrpD family protein, partial [Candidatus Zixiibacteriota bacterium]
GYTGTEAVFEGKEGFMDCFGPDWDTEKLVGNLGERFKILDCSMKAFPTEALTHTHISCVLKAVTENDIKPEDIDQVIVTTIARACDILFDPHKYRPDSRETADHSLPYCIAVAIVDRKVTTQSFSAEKMKDPRIWEVIDKIKGEASEEFEKMFPAKQPSKVVVRTKDGKAYSASLDYPKGDPRQPMTEDELRIKFNSLAQGWLSEEKQKEVETLIFGCEKHSAREFMQGLVVE